jgi:hypothetical protein
MPAKAPLREPAGRPFGEAPCASARACQAAIAQEPGIDLAGGVDLVAAPRSRIACAHDPQAVRRRRA